MNLTQNTMTRRAEREPGTAEAQAAGRTRLAEVEARLAAAAGRTCELTDYLTELQARKNEVRH